MSDCGMPLCPRLLSLDFSALISFSFYHTPSSQCGHISFHSSEQVNRGLILYMKPIEIEGPCSATYLPSVV